MSVIANGHAIMHEFCADGQTIAKLRDNRALSLWQEQPGRRVQPNIDSNGRNCRRLVSTESTGRWMQSCAHGWTLVCSFCFIHCSIYSQCSTSHIVDEMLSNFCLQMIICVAALRTPSFMLCCPLKDQRRIRSDKLHRMEHIWSRELRWVWI